MEKVWVVISSYDCDYGSPPDEKILSIHLTPEGAERRCNDEQWDHQEDPDYEFRIEAWDTVR